MDISVKILSPEEEALKSELCHRLNLHPISAHLLLLRHISSEEEARRFLFGGLQDLPNPFLLPEMEEAVEGLLQAANSGKRILFFGDYDVDGITGTAAISSFYRELGILTRSLLPHRLQDGYGLTRESLKKIEAEKPDLVVTIDNGTNAREEIAYLKEKGIETIVIDHHETPTERERPPARAIVNPKNPSSRFGERNLASAGLIFFLLMALRSRLREKGGSSLPNLKRYLDLACLGTIADIVPLTGANRLLVRFGLKELEETTRPGLKALKEQASLTGPVTMGSVAFRLAPRINAAGRLSDPRIALELLLAEEDSSARDLAQTLERLNRERQAVEERVVKEAVSLVESMDTDRKGLVVAGKGWHLGVVGIVAAKLAEKYGRPAVVLALSDKEQEAKGSARSIPGLSVYKCLKKVENRMTRFGGHDQAAGLALEPSLLEIFSQEFNQAVEEEWDRLDSRKIPIDADLPLSAINRTLLRELSLFEPHGPGNPEPLFIALGVHLINCRRVGKSGARHLKATVSHEGSQIKAIGFDLGPYLEKTQNILKHDMIYSPTLSRWDGAENPELKIKFIHSST